jgi:MFS transporter, ACS family, hexuronate transporter
MVIWSVASMGHALARTALGFGLARFFLGLGESGNFPAAIKATAEWFPQRERALATGIFNSGANLGAIVTPILIPWLTVRYGWQASFLLTGIFSVVWLVWWWAEYQSPRKHKRLSQAERAYIQTDPAPIAETVPWQRLMSYRQTWAVSLAKFMTDPIWWFYLYWLPKFFDSRFHLGLTQLGLPLVIVYNCSAVGSIAGGWLPASLHRRGLTMVNARFTAMFIAACLALPVLFIDKLSSEWAAVAVLGIAAAAHQGWSANLYTTISDMFPQRAVGAIAGTAGMAGAVGGMLFSIGIGYLLTLTHSYSLLFVISGSAYLLAFAALKLMVPKLTRVEV